MTLTTCFVANPGSCEKNPRCAWTNRPAWTSINRLRATCTPTSAFRISDRRGPDGHGARRGFQRLGCAGSQGLESGREPGDRRGDHTQRDRVGQHAPVGSQVEGSGAGDDRRPQDRRRPLGDRDADRRGRAAEDQGFGEQLPEQAEPPGSERHAHRHLVLSRGRPRQQQRGHVDTRQQEQHRCRAERDGEQQRRACAQLRILDQRTVRHEQRRGPAGHPFVRRPRQRAELLLDLLERSVRTPAADDDEPLSARIAEEPVRRLQRIELRVRDPDVAIAVGAARVSPRREGRCDTDDREWHAVQLDGAPDHLGIGAVDVPPEGFAEHRNSRVSCGALVGGQVAANDWRPGSITSNRLQEIRPPRTIPDSAPPSVRLRSRYAASDSSVRAESRYHA